MNQQMNSTNSFRAEKTERKFLTKQKEAIQSERKTKTGLNQEMNIRSFYQTKKPGFIGTEPEKISELLFPKETMSMTINAVLRENIEKRRLSQKTGRTGKNAKISFCNRKLWM
jgi:hypothetical protein